MGTSGGVSPDLRPGTLAITDFAVGLDSTGLYYDLPASDLAIVELEDLVLTRLDAAIELSCRFKGKIFPYASRASAIMTRELSKQSELWDVQAPLGITASVSGFYGPSGRYLEGLSNSISNIKQVLSEIEFEGLKVLNMEMESSLVFHLCSHLGIQVATICPVISATADQFEPIDYHNQIDQAIDIALSALRELS